jgi:hypothetical protein
MLVSEDCPVQRISGNGFGRGQTILIEGKDQTKNHREPPLAAPSARPHNITNQTSQRLSYFKPLPVSKTLTTDWQTMPPSSPAYEDFWWIIWPFGYVRQLPSSH